MKITSLALIFFLFCLFSCGSAGKKVDTVSEDSARTVIDTFSLGEKLCSLEQSSKQEFDAIVIPDYLSNEDLNINRDAGLVKRNCDSLFLKLNSGKFVALTNDTNSENADKFVDFKYCGFQKELGQYVIFAMAYEYYSYYLIGAERGDTTFCCGFPMVSPDKKYFICSNTDLIAGFTFNGLEYYQNLNKKPKVVTIKEFTKWGPDAIKWLNDSTFFMQRTLLDTADYSKSKNDWVKVRMRKK